MTIDGTAPVPASTALLAGAEDPIEDQHPVLQRLRTGSPDSAGVRTSAVWAIGARVGSQVIQFLGLIISARLLVPSDYGNAAVVVPVLVPGLDGRLLGGNGTGTGLAARARRRRTTRCCRWRASSSRAPSRRC